MATTSKYFRPSTRSLAKMANTCNQKPEKKVSSKIPRQKLKVRYEPEHWVRTLSNIRAMRSSFDAPVDVMGCERCTRDDVTEEEKRFHILVSLMLSSQTKDHVTYAAMSRLIEHGLTIDDIIGTSEEKLGSLIYPVGFWKKKVGYLKRACVMMKEEFGGDIPKCVESLVKLPGVGPKMAYLTMTCAWGIVVGIESIGRKSILCSLASDNKCVSLSHPSVSNA
ncbi:endonuclease III-like protein 1 isoform X2 [Ciona intestinalis]